MKKKTETQAREFVLTVYMAAGHLAFHAGPEGDFESDIKTDHDDEEIHVVKKFVIRGEILSEE